MTASTTPFLAPLLALTVAHALVVGVFLWLRGRRDDDPVRTDAQGRVACEACGVDNDPGYRYCRHCLAELPGPSPYADPASGTGSVSPF